MAMVLLQKLALIAWHDLIRVERGDAVSSLGLLIMSLLSLTALRNVLPEANKAKIFLVNAYQPSPVIQSIQLELE